MKHTFGLLVTSFFFCSLLFVQGCKEENTLISNGNGSLYDPAVKPSVIFTYPSNNAVGPFSGIYSGDDNYNYPHFKIQFNKIMNADMMNENKITIKGFDEPVAVSQAYYYSESGIYQFRIFRPNSGNQPVYQLGKTYTVTVAGTLEDMHNQMLGKDYVFTFTTGSALKIISSFPKDSFSSSSNEVKLNFNSQIDTNIFSKINISPAISGHWYISYTGTSMYFYPNNSFESNTIYTVTVAADAKDKFGNALGAVYTYSFSSGDFKILNSYPSNGDTYFSLTNNISFYCNTSILSSSIASAFSITPSIVGTFQTSGNYFYFQPTQPLNEKTTYTVILNTSLSAMNGNKLKNTYTISFTTVGFQVYQYYPNSSNASRYSNIEVQFNAPLDTATAKTGLSISPAVAGKIYFSNKNRTMIFKPDSIMQPNTQYSFNLSTALKSAQGNALEYSYSYSFTTGD